MKRTKARQQVWSYKRCEECDDTTHGSKLSRHQRAHGTYEVGQVPSSRPHVRYERSQQRDIDGTSLGEQAIIRRVARRLYTLQNLGVPDYAQLIIVHQEFPTLTANTRRVCQTMAKTTLTAVKNEIRAALPYIRCHSLGIGARHTPTENVPVTGSSSTSSIPPSGRDTGINHNMRVSAQEEILLLEDDTNNNEVLSQSPQLEASTPAPAVEENEERIATTKYRIKKRTERGRPTTYDSAQLQPLPQLTRQQPEKQPDPDMSATQILKEKSTTVGRNGTKQKASETTSTQETFESATSQKYVTPVDVLPKEQKERHRVLTSPWRSTPLEYDRRDQHPRQHSQERHYHSPSSSGDRDTTRRSRERSRQNESTYNYCHGNQQSDRGWRPSTTRQSDIDQLRREMMEEMRNMLKQSKTEGAL